MSSLGGAFMTDVMFLWYSPNQELIRVEMEKDRSELAGLKETLDDDNNRQQIRQ